MDIVAVDENAIGIRVFIVRPRDIAAIGVLRIRLGPAGIVEIEPPVHRMHVAHLNIHRRDEQRLSRVALTNAYLQTPPIRGHELHGNDSRPLTAKRQQA